MSSKILLRRGTAAEWSSANPILGNGELGIETDTLKIKIGNGSSTWSQLSSYANVTPAQLTSQINSLISAAPSTLDTLNELAAAINNDASFSTTVNNLLTGKVSKSGGDTITAATASTKGLVIKGASSQTASLLEWQDSSGNLLGRFHPTAGLLIPGLSNTNGGAAPYINFNTTNFALYPNLASNVGLIIQGAASQTANLQEWQNSAGTILAKVFATGYIYSSGFQVPVNGTSLFDSSNLSGTISLNSGGIAIEPRLTTNVALIVKGVSSQTANLQEWQNSGGSVVSSISNAGLATFSNVGVTNNINAYYGKISANTQAFGYLGQLSAITANASTIGLVVRGATSQTANLQEWQNSSGTVLAKIGINGDAEFVQGGVAITGGSALLVTSNIYSVYGKIQTGNGVSTPPSQLTTFASSASTIGLIVRGFASQTANLQEWQNSASTVLAKVDANGSAQFLGLNVQGTGSGIVNIGTAAAGYVGLIIKGVVSQTANLQEWQDSTNNILSKIDYRGILSSKVAFGDFWGPIWETVTAGSNDQSWKKLVVISLPDNYYSGIQFKIDINNAVTNYGSSSYPEKSTYTVSATRAGGTLNDTISMVLTGPEGDKYIRGMKLSNGTYEIQFRQPDDWRDVVVRVQPISAQPNLRGLSDLYTFYPLSTGGTAASTGGTIYTPVVGGTDRFSFISAQSFVKIGGTSSQFLKADGSVDSSTYMTTAIPYVAGHHAEGRYLASAALMNDLGNARLRGSTFTFTNISPTNSQIDTMFDGTAGVVVWTTSGITFPVVIEFTLPRTLQYGATVGVGFGNATWRANSVKIEAFSNGAWVTCIDTTTNTSEDVLANIPGSNATPGTTKLRYTFANPNSVQFRICHLWGFNYNSDMWTQLQMPRAGGTMYGSLAVQGYTQTLGTTNVVQNVIRGVSGQTSNLAEWQNSAGSVVSSIAPDGTSTLGSLYITAGTHKIYGPVEVLTNSSGNANLSLIGFGVSSSTNLTIGIKNTDSVNNRNWQLIVGGGNYSGQSGNWTGEGGLIFQENNPNDSSQVVRGGFRRGGQFALGGSNTYSASLSITPLSTSTIGQVVRANASQTASLQEWQLSDGSAAYTIDSNGHMFAGASKGLYLNTGYISGTRFAIASVGASQIGMIIRGNTSQTGNLTEWRNVSDTVLASIDANGQGAFKSTTLTASSSGVSALTLVAASGQTAPLLSTAGGAKITAGGNYFEAPAIQSNYIMSASAGNSTIVPFTVKGATSQTANLQEWQNDAGTVLARVDASGNLTVGNTTGTIQIKSTGTSAAYPSSGSGMELLAGTSSGVDSIITYNRDTSAWRGLSLYASPIRMFNSGTELFTIAANGSIGINNPSVSAVTLGIISNSASNITLAVKGAASQTADLQQWTNVGGTVLAKITASGALDVTAITVNGAALAGYSSPTIGSTSIASGATVTTLAGLSSVSSTTFVGALTGNASTVTNGVYTNAANIITPATSTTIPLLVKGAASQTANLQEWQDSAGTVVSAINSSGFFAGSSVNLANFGQLYQVGLTANQVSVVVSGATSQTADLQEWRSNQSSAAVAKIDVNGNFKGGLVYNINDQLGTSYTFVLSDSKAVVTLNNANNITASIPTNSTPFPIGSSITIVQYGLGQVTIQALTPGTTTILSNAVTSTAPRLRGILSSATLIKVAAEGWIVIGDIY